MSHSIFSGSGIRVKILEAMAEGKTVISTTMGVEGINATNDENILIADDADAFARQIKRCLKEPEVCLRIGENSRTFVKQQYDNENLVKDLLKFYNYLLA